MSFQQTKILVVALASLIGFSDAFWRMSCSIIQTGRIDPIVDPGGIPPHVHKISGASSEYSRSVAFLRQKQDRG